MSNAATRASTHRGAAGIGLRFQAGRRVSAKDLGREIAERVDRRSLSVTDEFASRKPAGKPLEGGHEKANRDSGQHVREGGVTTDTFEGAFSLLQRGRRGTFHLVS